MKEGKIRKLLLILSVILPNFMKMWVYRNLMKWEIGSQTKIGFSYIDAEQVILGDNIKIGHFNIIRNMRHFQVGSNSYIANFNDFFGAKYPDWDSRLVLEEKVLFMSHHFVDVGGNVIIGSRTTVGGRDTHFWSHSQIYEMGNPKLSAMDIHIGSDVYIGARATLVCCKIPDKAIVGAGSVVTKMFTPENCPLLIAGNPAVIKKRYETADAKLNVI